MHADPAGDWVEAGRGRDSGSPRGGVAVIAGAGPVGVDVVRELLADPDVAVTMRRLITDPLTGHLLDLGRTRYEVPDRLREYLTIGDLTCRFPGCARKASRCQVDHADPWDDGGGTDRRNLGALCVRHHQLKTHTGWTITSSHPDGSCAWISPHAREYQHEATPIGRSARLRDEADARWREKWGLPPAGTADPVSDDDAPF
jgi:hypothetical protein